MRSSVTSPSVSVPVLSVASTVTRASVSTAWSCCTSTFLCPRRITATAWAMLSSSTSPWGTRATTPATVPMSVSRTVSSSLARCPKNKMAAVGMIAHVTTWRMRSMPRASSDFCALNFLASAVRRCAYESAPTAVARARPPPATTKLPDISSSPTCFSTASDSPVSSDSSTVSPSDWSASPSTTIWSPGCSSNTSSSTTCSLATSWRSPSRSTVTFGALTSERRSRVALARHSWMTPMRMFSTITNPNRASFGSPSTRTVPVSTAMMALNRVKMFARMISPIVRDERVSAVLALPAATRLATSLAVSPRGAARLASLMKAKR